MPKMKSLVKFFLLLIVAGAFVNGMFYVFGGLLRSNILDEPVQHDPEDISRVEADRDTSFDEDDLFALHQRVDYSEGENASWYPKGESPFLAELVDEGRLPPVEERVGPEPVVLKGVDGIGNYGGTWHRGDGFATISNRLAASNWMRWSPLGYPVKPHFAKDLEIRDEGREYIIHMRRGLRWSDGHPVTADDMIYRWEHEEKYFEHRPRIMIIHGEMGDIEKIDDYTLRYTFPHPHGLFPELMAGPEALMPAPAHFLRQFHPELGDPEKIEAMMDVQGAPSPRAAYFRLRDVRNPEYPRLWPWVPRTYSANPPYEFVRNPYYWVVDTEGNQLPYIDRVLFADFDEDMIAVTASAGDLTMQLRDIRFQDYTLYMDQREAGGYNVYHWAPAGASDYAVFPNLNRRIDPNRPATKWKNKMLGDKRFRQALSLAIDRELIIEAEYEGMTEPAQLDPGKGSFFHHPPLFKAFTEHDPERANELLDELELTGRDAEGYRTFPDGTIMTFLLNVTDFTGTGPAQFLIENWSGVGIRVILQEQTRALNNQLRASHQLDLAVHVGESEYQPVLRPSSFVPTFSWSLQAPGYGAWFHLGGLYGDEEAEARESAVDPTDRHPEILRAMEVLEAARAEPDLEDQREVFKEALDIAAENLWTINISTAPPQPVIVQDGVRNVPRNALCGYVFLTPGNAGIDTYYFEEPRDSPGAIAHMKRSMIRVRPDPSLTLNDGGARDGDEDGERSRVGEAAGRLLRFLIWGSLVLGGLMIAVKHPFVGRRCLILIPTIFVISIVTFTIIQLPPGDYIEHQLVVLEMEGNEAAMQRLEELREIFHMDDPMVVRYMRWMGVHWFGTFDSGDRGLLQGRMGISMEHVRPVNDLIGDRLLLTFLISLFTILFTWAVAVPTGIYSALRQYSVGDYALTLIGFLGLSFPNFLLALVLMYIGGSILGLHVTGLFSPEYAAQPEWTFGKFIDLLQHIWIPVVVLGTAGTAGMLRVMRANLLDELRKPYVVTAMAKGVRPVKLVLKYPVRLALNPFISGIGNIFPRLISGGAIVALVLSLPTVGPLMLTALLSQDMYLAGSMLMLLSLLAVFGTLVSDLLLMWLDPRIRMGGGE